MKTLTEQEVVDEFHKLVYQPAHETTYCGIPMWKNPTDVFVLQEILWEVRPSLIVECGTAFGASALWMAHFMDLHIPDGQIISADIWSGEDFHGHRLPKHPRITYVRGRSSVDLEVVHFIAEQITYLPPEAKVLVILDSLHTQEHVHAEMCAYAPLVSMGSYLIVEDLNVNGHPVFKEHGPGPYEAVEQFLNEKHPEVFTEDERYRKYLLSFHAGGWLRRVA